MSTRRGRRKWNGTRYSRDEGRREGRERASGTDCDPRSETVRLSPGLGDSGVLVEALDGHHNSAVGVFWKLRLVYAIGYEPLPNLSRPCPPLRSRRPSRRCPWKKNENLIQVDLGRSMSA